MSVGEAAGLQAPGPVERGGHAGRHLRREHVLDERGLLDDLEDRIDLEVRVGLITQPSSRVVSTRPFCRTDRAGPVMRSTTGSGSVWLATPADASTPTMTRARA